MSCRQSLLSSPSSTLWTRAHRSCHSRSSPGVKASGEPKKPRAAYIFFSSETVKRLQAEQPGLGIGEYATEAGARWRALSAEGRRPYEEMALEDARRYARERDAFLLAEGALQQTDTVTRSKVSAVCLTSTA